MCKSKIRCDLCSTLVHNYEFDDHYQNCNEPKNAFNILMNVENGNHKTEGKIIWTIIPQHHQMVSNG